MPYTPETWEDFPSTDTPITAARLNNIETGVDLAVALGEAAVPAATVNAKGDILIGTANDTVSRQAVGANSTVLMANSAQSTGMEWTSDVPVAALAPGSEGQSLLTTGGVPVWGTAAGVPAGVVLPYGGSTAPTGYVLADGTAVSRTGQATLFAIFGTTYGSGDGSTTFNLPDLRGRLPVGKGTNTSVDTLGESDGLAEASRRPHHRHTVTSDAMRPGATGINTGGTNAASLAVITVGPAGSNLDAPAYITLNYIIKT